MNEIANEIATTFEYVRRSLSDVNISDSVKHQLDEILSPVFSDPTSSARITDAINDLGDFSENVLTPLLEQYIGAHTAARLRFAIEDLLISIEKYRDLHMKRINSSANPSVSMTSRGNNKNLPGVTMRSTNPYRQALRSNAKGIARVGTMKRTMSLASVRSVNSLSSKAGASSKMPTAMTSIIYEREHHKLSNVPECAVPKIAKAGEVLVKVSCCGLNTYDYSHVAVTLFPAAGMAAAAQVIPNATATIRTSFTKFKSSFNLSVRTLRATTQAEPTPPVTAAEGKLGVEFVGLVKDIGWSKGDYLHMLPVAKEQRVFGIALPKRGALGEYLVTHVSNIVKVPKGISDQQAASLAIDGAAVVRALASSDISKHHCVCIIAADTNAGQMLLQLLLNDVGAQKSNLVLLVHTDHMQLFKEENEFPNVFEINNLNKIDEQFNSGGLDDHQIDVVFDCSSETVFSSKFNVHKLLKKTGKMKNMAAIHYVSGSNVITKLLTEEGDHEEWQKEMKLLCSKVKDKIITFDYLGSDSVEEVGYDAEDVELGLTRLRNVETWAKLVVNVNEEGVDAMKAVLGRPLA